MKTVIISKDKLLKKVQENREKHRRIFEDALTGWKKLVIEALDKAWHDALEGNRYETYIALPRPDDHTSEYDIIIQQVDWSEETKIELEFHQFNQFVLDEWGWKEDFLMSASSYSSSSSSSSSLLASELKNLKKGA